MHNIVYLMSYKTNFHQTADETKKNKKKKKDDFTTAKGN